MQKVLMVIKGKALAGKRDDIQASFEKHLAPRAEANESQEVVVWAADQADPDAFYLIEIYSDESAAAENSQASWFADYMSETMPLLDGQPDFGTATPRWIKGVATKV